MFIDTQVRPQGEQQQVGKLKLSEAIRIGARIRPQCRYDAFRNGKSCAWGAAWEGSGHPYQEDKTHVQIWASSDEWMAASRALRASCGVGVAELNDRGESRGQIANRLEALGL